MKNRKNNRLKGYDYSQNGLYVVTVCTKDRTTWFGKVENNEMILNKFGEIVQECWLDLPNRYVNCTLDEFIVMPNHFHGIVEINDNVGTGLKPVPTEHGLSEIVRGFKTFSSRQINSTLDDDRLFRWQRSFHDHIFRKEKSLNKMREYIIINLLEWNNDKNNLINN